MLLIAGPLSSVGRGEKTNQCPVRKCVHTIRSQRAAARGRLKALHAMRIMLHRRASQLCRARTWRDSFRPRPRPDASNRGQAGISRFRARASSARNVRFTRTARSVCGKYKCQLLEKVEAGTTEFETAIDRVAVAKGLAARVHSVLPAGMTLPEAREQTKGELSPETGPSDASPRICP